jgi:hypothetical protein
VKRMLAALWAALSSRVLSFLVLGFFLLLYIAIAFFTDETLTTLIALTGRNLLLAAILSLLPINIACRIVVEVLRFFKMRRALTRGVLGAGLYDESISLTAPPALVELQERLDAAGYTTRKTEDRLAAWRGISLSPARVLLLAGTFCVFAGIFLSLEGRTVQRHAVVEGELFPSFSGNGGLVQRILFQKSSGPILSKELFMEVEEPGQGGRIKRYQIYPPNQSEGAFAYPRYLGVALDLRFFAPELPGGFENKDVYPLYPPGKEASVAIPGSPYRLVLSLAKAEDGTDPFMTGRLSFRFKLLKGTDELFTGILSKGTEFVRDGIRISFPDVRRMVITDFVVDYGVWLIWCSAFLFPLAALIWLLVRFFFPRREMLFLCSNNTVQAYSHAEGGIRRHNGIFHEMLDVLAAKQPGEIK